MTTFEIKELVNITVTTHKHKFSKRVWIVSDGSFNAVQAQVNKIINLDFPRIGEIKHSGWNYV